MTILLGGSLLLPATSALAATSGRQDDSSLLIWAFVAMCALIVALQLRPAVILSCRLLKEMFHTVIQEAEEEDEDELTVHRAHK
jgi:hypothetical protein